MVDLDAWMKEAVEINKFIETEGYGRKAKFFDKDDVINLLIAYKQKIRMEELTAKELVEKNNGARRNR